LLNLKRGFDETSCQNIFQGQAFPDSQKPELIGIFKLTFREQKNHRNCTKSSQKSLSCTKWFNAPLVRWYHYIFLKTCQFITADRMSLVSPPSSNGWTIPLTYMSCCATLEDLINCSSEVLLYKIGRIRRQFDLVGKVGHGYRSVDIVALSACSLSN
jgi:hypothetical protein